VQDVQVLWVRRVMEVVVEGGSGQGLSEDPVVGGY
jgi:hypothetical protein